MPQPEREPQLIVRIKGPAEGATLSESREGRPDRIDIILTKKNMQNDVDVTIRVNHPASGSQPALNYQEDWDEQQSAAFIQFRRSGPAIITAIAEGTTDRGGRMTEESEEVSINIAPTQRQPFDVKLGDVAAASASFNIPEGGCSLDISVAATGPTKSVKHVEIQTSLDNYASTQRLTKELIERGEMFFPVWKGKIFIADEKVPAPSAGYILRVRDVDHFEVSTETNFTFWTKDNTPPKIDIQEPKEDHVYLFESLPKRLWVRGTIADSQSKFKDSSLTYAFAGASGIPVTVVNDTWAFELEITSFGNYELTMNASDKSGNTHPSTKLPTRQFEVVSTYIPKSIDELLSPDAYLKELLRFSSSHLLTGPGGALNTDVLANAFFQDFGKLAQSGRSTQEQTNIDLFTAVQILRVNDLNEADSAVPRFANVHPVDTAGLIAWWTFTQFDEITTLLDEGRFKLNGVLSSGVRVGETEFEGALILEPKSYVKIEHRAALEVGKDNRDFSVSFWILVRENGRPGGPWRSILYKGHQRPGDMNRTFGLWLRPESNRIHFRITRKGEPNDGGDSTKKLGKGWRHVTYVKSGSQLLLFIDGALDMEVDLKGEVIINVDPLYIGANPHYQGFDGAISDLRIYAFALSGQDIEQIAFDRRTTPSSPPIKNYHQAAYEALLVGLGTSYEELRLLNTLSADRRTALAARLGLTMPGGTENILENLLSDIPPGTPKFEAWLEETFGLPSTIPSEIVYRIEPEVLRRRRESIAFLWETNPEGPGHVSAPFLDPDLVDPEDLSPKVSDWQTLLKQRHLQLEKQYAKLMDVESIDQALTEVYSDDEVIYLWELEASEQAGNSIEPDLRKLSLTLPMFRHFLGYRGLGDSLSKREKEDISHILTQVWKLRNRYPVWRGEESALSTRLWPTPHAAAAWEPGHYKRSFLPWRGNTQARSDLESLLAGRIRDWIALEEGYASMVTNVQRATLPGLRDGLLGMSDLPSANLRMDELTERWLVDFAATGATSLTPVEQATIILQSLINGIRNKRFETDHPAHKWKSKADPFENHFDEEWKWIGNYGTWRGAVMNYLYPENALYPELYSELSPEFKTFLKELRKLQPLTNEKLTELGSPFKVAFDKLQGGEKEYFAPVAIALALQRARLFTLALDWYRKVYDSSKPPGYESDPERRPMKRKQVPKLGEEDDSLPPSPNFNSDNQWTLNLTNPHAVAIRQEGGKRVFGNPYTRYTLMQIVLCMLSQGEADFAAGTLDSRARALALYLEIKEILAFDELRDLKPADPMQVYLPNPILAAQRAQVEVSLRKLRSGLSFLGTPLQADPVRSGGGTAISSLVRPTPYRFKVLMERAKQLVGQAQQIEQQYLSAIVGGDAEREKFMRENFTLEIASQTVALRTLYETEANNGKILAERQKKRSEIQRDQYKEWIAAGPNENETRQVEELWSAKTLRDVIGGIDAVITAVNGLPRGPLEQIDPFDWAKSSVITYAATGRAIAQGYLNAAETQAQVSGILASQERRRDEWVLGQNVAAQDVFIGDQQITLAQNRIDIAKQESLIASTQKDHAQQMVTFLTNKFTSVEFYDWLQGALAEVYSFFLRISTSTAQQAELQLAFERQESPGRLIKSDYWTMASLSESNSKTADAPDRRGISGSARLLQDIYNLDQQAFNSERRLLNLGHVISLARTMPIEFQEFRRTGVLVFTTPLQLFDDGFPGHYMRLIKRVRLSVAALISPNMGIRATLTNNGLSRVVTGGPAYQTVILRQDPQSVALTSPSASTGVFELDMQTDLLYPFEGSGVDTTWVLELPPAGNPFDFSTIADVVMSIEYTALGSFELRDRVIKQLPRKWSGSQAFSVRRDFPDEWYEINNFSGNVVPSVEIRLEPRDFPPGLGNLAVDELAVAMRLKDGIEAKFAVQPALRPIGQQSWIDGIVAHAINGVASTRQSGASGWRRVLLGKQGSNADWRFVFSDINVNEFSLIQALRKGDVEDIMIVFTLSGIKPAW